MKTGRRSRAQWILTAAGVALATAGWSIADYGHDNDCVLEWGPYIISRRTCASLDADTPAACREACRELARRLEATAQCVHEWNDGSPCVSSPGPGPSFSASPARSIATEIAVAE